jgi:hypothetical protein
MGFRVTIEQGKRRVEYLSSSDMVKGNVLPKIYDYFSNGCARVNGLPQVPSEFSVLSPEHEECICGDDVKSDILRYFEEGLANGSMLNSGEYMSIKVAPVGYPTEHITENHPEIGLSLLYL